MTTTETAPEHSTADASAPFGTDAAARSHLMVAPVFGLAGLLLYAAVAIKAVEPAFLSGSDVLAYGRLFPVATNVLLWGWLTTALLGAAFFMVPRMAGTRLRGGPLPLLSLALVAGGSTAGAVAVGLGNTAGGRFLELPLWADAAVALGAGAAAAAITATVRAGDRDRLPVAQWYFLAATWWLFLSVVVGAVVPFLDGMGAALTGWFSVTATIGLWLASAGIGTAYYLVRVLVPGATFNPRLGRIGFWSVAFAWAWTAPRVFQYGPTPDWLETTPVVFSLALIVGAATILADFSAALSGKWSAVGSSLPLKFTVLGLGLFALMPLQMLVQSFRGASAVVHFTAWESAFEQLVLFGPFGFFAMAAIYHVASASTGRRWSPVLGAMHLWIGFIGVLVVVASRWIAGLQQGYTWIAGVNSREFANSGAGFRNSVAPLDGAQWMQVAGLGIVLAAFLAFLAGWVRAGFGSGGEGDPAWPVPSEAEPVQRFGIVAQGAVLLFVVALLGVAVLPLADADTSPSILAEDSRGSLSAAAAEGREIYVREGCWYCHTQQVRAAVPDVGLGPVSVMGDYAFDDVDVTGFERVGPDLAHIGTRLIEDPSWSTIGPAAYLADPGTGRPWSRMPAYDHLPPAELDALAAYLASLE